MTRLALEFQAEHRHPTLGMLDILLIVDTRGKCRLQRIKFATETIAEGELVARRYYTVYFNGDSRQATFAQWKDPWNGTHGASEVSDEPFLADLNAFAVSATLRRIMRRKLRLAAYLLGVALKQVTA